MNKLSHLENDIKKEDLADNNRIKRENNARINF